MPIAATAIKARLIVTSLCFEESAAEVMHAQRRARSNIKPSLYRRQRVSVVSAANENPARACGSFQREVRAGSREFLTREGWEDFHQAKHHHGPGKSIRQK